jgi:hypothetical protein
MENQDLDIIYVQLKDKYALLLTNTFALDDGYSIDVKVLCGKSKLGRFHLYKECPDDNQFVFSVELANPKKMTSHSACDKYTHWHPQSAEQAVKDVIAFMEGTHKWL